jgi:hypothetical protein
MGFVMWCSLERSYTLFSTASHLLEANGRKQEAKRLVTSLASISKEPYFERKVTGFNFLPTEASLPLKRGLCAGKPKCGKSTKRLAVGSCNSIPFGNYLDSATPAVASLIKNRLIELM